MPTKDDEGTEATKREGTPRAGTDVTYREGTPRVASEKRAAPTAAPTAAPNDFSEAPKVEYLSRGTLVSRYVIVDVLGEGGMGVVYGAFDPELDRKIAIKLLQTHSDGSSGGEKAWIQREAQALARLSHPNVVAVHDVGTLPGGQVFVAMELVEGDTLRVWLKERERSWREVVAVMLAAGTGLAAAHRAGLIHRDFKPDNVIVGKDGRARVMDFGLARLRAEDDVGAPARHQSDLKIDSRSPLSDSLTVAGMVVGTPAYMAPEIYDGQVADARTDQFSFGVALYEALYRTRPYNKTDLKSSPVPKTPPDVGVPAQIQRVVMRAISIDREQRFASIDDLLAELSIDPARGRKRVLAAAGVAVLAAAVGGGVYMMKSTTSKSELCLGAERRLAGVWDPAIKPTVKAAYLATKQPFAAQAYAGLEKALDRYTGEWIATMTESCKATHVRGEQSETIQALRQACLDQDLEVLRGLVQIEASADSSLVQKGDKAAFELDPLAHCSNITALANPGRPPDAITDKVIEVSKQIAVAKADVIGGKYLPALVAAKHAVDGARKLGWDPLLAEALGTNAGALLATGNQGDAAPLLEEAIKAAVRGRRDDLAAGAAMANAMVAAQTGSPEKARMWLEIGEASAVRGGVDRALEVKRYDIEGMVYGLNGDLNAAVAAHEKALAASKLELGPDGPGTWEAEQLLGTTYTKVGAFAKAAPHFERALMLREQSVGPDHPDVALTLSNLGVCYRHLHDPRARPTFERALAIREKIYGPRSPMIVATLDNFAEYLQQEKDYPAALAMFDRGKQIAKIIPGTANAVYHTLANDYAEALVAAGKLADAHRAFDELIPLEEKVESSMLPDSLVSRAELALVEKKWADAATFAKRGLAGFETQGGKDNPRLWRPLSRLAAAEIGLGHRDAARPLLERAIAIGEKAQVLPDDLAPARAALAQLASESKPK